MIDIRSYNNLLGNMCIILNCNDVIKRNAEKYLKKYFENITDLRCFIENEHLNEYTNISYFFIIYAILSFCIAKEKSKNLFDVFNDYTTIESILKNSTIEKDLYHFNSEEEYINKYKTDFELINHGINKDIKISEGNLDMIISKYWDIVNLLNGDIL